MKPLLKQTQQYILGLLQKGQSVGKVSRSVKVSKSSVSKIRRAHEDSIPSPKMGRPSKITKRTKTLLSRQFDIGELLTLRDGQDLVHRVKGVHVDKESIRNYLKQEGLRGYVQRKKRDLTEDQIAVRYQFAKDHLHWTVDDWKHVMFSDETAISRTGSCGRKYYYKKPGNKRILPHQVQKTKQGGGGEILMWGCITYYGVGYSCRLVGGLDATAYVGVLKDYVFSSWDWYGADRDKLLFQQDNSSIHTACLTKKFIKKAKIRLLEWPVNSPDLNPIENVWAHIKRELGYYSEAPNSLDELWTRVEYIWENTEEEFLRQLYESMPRRIRLLYDNKGGHIKY